MKTPLTGDAEIDEQHAILECIVVGLKGICFLSKIRAVSNCTKCAQPTRDNCTSQFKDAISQARLFLGGHLAYEEKLMGLLPNCERCAIHISVHKESHRQILQQLQMFEELIPYSEPCAMCEEIMDYFDAWLQDHASAYDIALAEQLNSGASENGLDVELVSMLNTHVFPDRPNRTRYAASHYSGSRKALPRLRKLFSSLTPSQRRVFWLISLGKSNPDIADELRISVNTVKTHRAAIFRKLEIGSLVELVRMSDVLR